MAIVLNIDADDSSTYVEQVVAAKLGVTGLGQYFYDRYQKGDTADIILNDLRYELDDSEAGKAAFRKYSAIYPSMKEFATNPNIFGQVEVPEFAYGEYRRTVRGAAARYGVNESLTNDSKIVEYIRNFNSPDEIVERMQRASIAASTTPPETLAFLQENYGIQNSDITSFFLDPSTMQTELVKRYDAARIAGEAMRNKFNISKTSAETLAERNVTAAQAAAGFETAAALRGLTGGGAATVSEQDIINSQFGDVTAGMNVQNALRSRAARFQEGGGYTAGQSGVVGLGTSTV